MIDYETALAQVLAGVDAVPQQQPLSLLKAQGHYLSSDLQAAIAVPNFDNSAMDGYAVCCADITLQKSYKITQRITAGDSANVLEAGTVAHIFTGAMLPPNADAVILQEDSLVDTVTGELRFNEMPTLNQHIRRAGEDIKKGTLLVAKGEQLSPTKTGLLASVGIAEVACYRRLKVAFFSTGDELLEPSQTLQAGKIFNSNRYALLAAVHDLGAEFIDLGVCPDEPKATADRLLQASELADCVITTGGMSVGDEDHVRKQSQQLGDIGFWKVAIKPGKPFAFGNINNATFFGLPGNPVSSYVTFQLLVRPWLLKRMGANSWLSQTRVATARFDYHNRSKRLEFLRGRLAYDAAANVVVDTYAQQGSGVFSSVDYASALIPVQGQMAVTDGDLVNVICLS